MRTLERLHPISLSGSGIEGPRKIHDVRPQYPEEAMAAKIQGQTEIEAIVDEAGLVADARVISGVPELNDAALDAVKQWRFLPTVLDGSPTAVIITCTITFTIR